MRALLAVGAAAALLAGCADISGTSDLPVSHAVSPAASLPADVAALGMQSGEYLVTLRPGIPKEQLADTIAVVLGMTGVQSAEIMNGELDVQFRSGTDDDHRRVLRQLVPLGKVREGI
jgi:hypothetical protein